MSEAQQEFWPQESGPQEFGRQGDEAFALGAGAKILRGFLRARAAEVLAAIEDVAKAAPFRRMSTPGGRKIAVAMTNCGAYGWVSDRRGYRYQAEDPDSGQPWPATPLLLQELAIAAAAEAGYRNFAPDACLINLYAPGVGMSLHQDRDERDFSQPIVSFSLGLPAVFLWGGFVRSEKPRRENLRHGDALVWGGPDRLRFHGVDRLKPGADPLCGGCRYNLTFRRAR